MTVGELKQILAPLPDDVVVATEYDCVGLYNVNVFPPDDKRPAVIIALDETQPVCLGPNSAA